MEETDAASASLERPCTQRDEWIDALRSGLVTVVQWMVELRSVSDAVLSADVTFCRPGKREVRDASEVWRSTEAFERVSRLE